mgnify:CR=1 FL=1
MQKNTKWSTRMVVEGGIMLALSFLLDKIVLFRMPYGGSVTLARKLPLVIFAIRWGVKAGMIEGALFGLLNMLIGGYVIHPAQAILDYILSASMIGLAGIKFGNEKKLTSFIPSIIIAFLASGVFNVISGQIFFYSMTSAREAGFDKFIFYNIALNYSVLLADMAILLIVYAISYKSLNKLYDDQREKII